MPTAVTLRSRLPEISRTLQLRVNNDLREAAENIVEGAKERNNDVSGDMDESMSVTGGAGEWSANVGVFYAKYVEFGRANAPPYPFLIPAAEAEAQPLESRVSATLKTL